MKHKIILADDHPFLLDGLKMVLKDFSSLTISATAQNGYDLMALVEKELPALVILDLNMPIYDGFQCLRKIKANFPFTRVLILSNYVQAELIEEVKKMGADGYLMKSSSTVELRAAIERILTGRKYFPSAAEPEKIPEESFYLDDFLKKYQLTKREVGIIRMICHEMSSKEIAEGLFLSELTINTHRRNILRKLELKNVAGIINFAKQNHLF